MTLIELKIELNRVAEALEKIVFLLERLVYPPSSDFHVKQSTLDDLHIITPEDLERITGEQVAFAERYRVVPGSEACARALVEWEQEQRSLHGESWQAPDWATVFAAAATRPDGEPARPVSPATAQTADRH